MNERRVETVNISTKQGIVAYAKVAARLAAYHADTAEARIDTTCTFPVDGYVLCRAVVTTTKGTFSGHSFGRCDSQKALEKQETIAVGRALGFAGYLSSGEIATAEEMEDIVTTEQLNGLKLRWAKENATSLEGLDRETKSQRFNAWCRSICGEDVDYRDAAQWSREAYLQAWTELTGVSPDVPFGA